MKIYDGSSIKLNSSIYTKYIYGRGRAGSRAGASGGSGRIGARAVYMRGLLNLLMLYV